MPGTLPREATHCSSVPFITSRSVPKIFSTTWPRTPLTASSTLSLMGPEKLKLTPGISVSDARIASLRRSFVHPGRHLSRGATWTKVSLMLTPSSSVPSSGRPCSLSVPSTSGNASNRVRTSWRICPPRSSAMLGGISTKITMSPSSSSGRNSLPEPRGDEPRREHQAHHADQHDDPPAEQPRHQPLVPVAHPDEQLRLANLGVAGAQDHRAERRDDGQREHQRTQQGKAVGQRQRAENAALHPLQREHRNERRDDDRHREERRARHVNRGMNDELKELPAALRLLAMRFVQHVFNQHDRAVDEDAEIDRAHRDQVGRQVNQLQPDERREQSQRDDRRHDQRAPDAPQKQPDDPNHEERAEQQIVVDGAERFAYEIRPVVERADPHALRQDALVQLPDLFVDPVEDHTRVFAAAQEREALGDLSLQRCSPPHPAAACATGPRARRRPP